LERLAPTTLTREAEAATLPPEHPARGTLDVLAVVLDTASAEAITATLGNSLQTRVEYGDVAKAEALLSEMASPRLLVADIAGTAEPLTSLERIADICPTGTGVILVGDSDDELLRQELQAMGIAHYLIKPLEPIRLREAIMAANGGVPMNAFPAGDTVVNGAAHAPVKDVRDDTAGQLPEPPAGSDPISRRALQSYAPVQPYPAAAPLAPAEPTPYADPSADELPVIAPMADVEPLPRAVDLLAFLTDMHSASLIAALIEPYGGSGRVVPSGIDTAVDYFAENASPKLLLVDVAGTADPMARVDALAQVCAAGTSVIVVGEENDVGLYRALKAVGVFEYLVKPLQPEAVKAALLNAAAGGIEHQLDASKPVIFVLGTRGGVGASTVAIGLAGELASRSKKVVLLDLDLQYGSVALALDTQPGQGLRDVLESPDRLDSIFLNSTSVKVSDNLYILSAEEGVSDPIAFQPEAVERLLGELTRHFDIIVVDIPRHVASSSWNVIGHAHYVLLVSDLSLVGIRDTSRLLAAAKGSIDAAKIKLLLTGLGGEHHGAKIDHKEFESALKRKIDFVLPHDAKAVLAANQAARPVSHVASGSRLADSFRTICTRLFEETRAKPPRKRRGLFSFRRSRD
jgi:pilus assembly protein CpaE